MSETEPDNLAACEERKREAAWDPALRWKVLQETIAWADSQKTGGRNTRQACLRLQRSKLQRSGGE